MNKILILGKGGQLSNALSALLGGQTLLAGRDTVNFLNADFISDMEQFIKKETISAVFNAVAYTQVDLSETTGKSDAFRINGTAVGELAIWCKKRGIPLVHFSSDYVFDGSGTMPWTENSKPHPVNAYGESKLQGEQLLALSGADYLLFRTSWLYDATGKNFFTTIRRLLSEKEMLNVVADQIGAPTYVPHLAKAAVDCLAARKSLGIYHLCSAGETSWYGFAKAIFEHEKKRNPNLKCQSVNPITSSQYPLPAPRPHNSRLNCRKVKETFGITMPSWEEGVKECLALANR